MSSHGGFLVGAMSIIHEVPEETEVVAAVGVACGFGQFPNLHSRSKLILGGGDWVPEIF